MLVTPSTLNSDPVGTLARRGIIAVLLRVFTASPVVLCPVKFIVELWIENEHYDTKFWWGWFESLSPTV